MELRKLVYADWCGPCKMVAPTFESLSTKFSKPGKITFVKVNVDNQQPIASAHGVRAMPTFLVFKSGSVIDTIQGANPPGLTAAVEKAVKLAGPGGGAQGAVFKTPGRTLGGSGASSSRGGRKFSRPWSFSALGFFNAIMTFFGLYLVSLFSVSMACFSIDLSNTIRCSLQVVLLTSLLPFLVRSLQGGRELRFQRTQTEQRCLWQGIWRKEHTGSGQGRPSDWRREDAGRPGR